MVTVNQLLSRAPGVVAIAVLASSTVPRVC
jgi:hypothetical protein